MHQFLQTSLKHKDNCFASAIAHSSTWKIISLESSLHVSVSSSLNIHQEQTAPVSGSSLNVYVGDL